MLHKISWLLILTFSLGCMKIKKKTEGDTPAAEPTVQIQTVQMQEAEVKPTSLDFDYEIEGTIQRVVFQVPAHWPQRIVVEKAVGGEKTLPHEIVFENGVWKDHLDQGGRKATYKFYENVSGSMRLLEQVDVLPALDLWLDQDKPLEELTGPLQFFKKIKIRNLELHNSARLFIADFKGKLIIENIQSNKGSIQTFAEGARAVQGHGRSVGNFDLYIKEGVGELYLNLFAEAGAHGQPGAEPNEVLTGTRGAEGEPAQFKNTGPEPCFNSYQVMCLRIPIFNCSKPPKQGEDGGNGKRGYPGQPGFNGGSVQEVRLVNQSSALLVKVLKRVGQKGFGGPGGAGGKGGEPGRGGDGGLRDLLRSNKLNPDDPTSLHKLGGNLAETCPAAPAGQRGQMGPVGEKGPDGQDGTIF